MVVANFLLSPEAQAMKQSAEVWGDDTVLALSKLSASERRRFESLPQGVATLPPEALGPTLLEPHPSWMTRIERSEEHTSELQSLMRISYAVFCLKKKTQQTNNNVQTVMKPYQ